MSEQKYQDFSEKDKLNQRLEILRNRQNNLAELIQNGKNNKELELEFMKNSETIEGIELKLKVKQPEKKESKNYDKKERQFSYSSNDDSFPRKYDDNDIGTYISVLLDHQLGGYKKNEFYNKKYFFCLKGEYDKCFGSEETDKRYIVAVLPAIDTAGKSVAITYFFNKKLHQHKNALGDLLESLMNHFLELKELLEKNEQDVFEEKLLVLLEGKVDQKEKDMINVIIKELKNIENEGDLKNRIKQLELQDQDKDHDLFDEIGEYLKYEDSVNIKILFPYNMTLHHWLLGEILIEKTDKQYKIDIFAHDPYGGGKMDEVPFVCLKSIFEDQIKKNSKYETIIKINNATSPYNRRQSSSDDKSCGVIVAEDLYKRIQGKSLNIIHPYKSGCFELRKKQVDVVKKYLNEDQRGQSFIERNKKEYEHDVEDSGVFSKYYSQTNSLQTLFNNLKPKELKSVPNQLQKQKTEDNMIFLSNILNVKKIDKEFEEGIQLLKKGYQEKNYLYQMNGFMALGKIYYDKAINLDKKFIEEEKELQKNHQRYRYFTHATALYTYALAICDDSIKNKNFLEKSAVYQKDIIQFIKQVEENYLTSIYIEKSKLSDWKLDQLHREFLESLRNETRIKLKRKLALEKMGLSRLKKEASRIERIEFIDNYLMEHQLTTQQIYQEVSHSLRTFIKNLINECKKTLGEPPCKYAVIGFGSLARDEATPYSDLEFAILIDDVNVEKCDMENDEIEDENLEIGKKISQENKEYFRRLTRLLHLKILHLGETTPRMQYIEILDGVGLLDRYSDNPVKNGFTFDGQNKDGRKTPLGNKHFEDVPEEQQYELILTPTEMAGLCNEENYKKDKHLSTLLQEAVLLNGDNELLIIYQENLKKIMSLTIEDDMHSMMLSEKRALNLLKETQYKFEPKLGIHDKAGHFFDAKYDFYRLPNMVFDHLALYAGIRVSSLWEKIEQLSKDGWFNKEGTTHLKYVVSTICQIRLSCYLNHDGQDNHVIALDVDDPTCNEKLLAHYFHIDFKEIAEIYFIMMPLYSCMNHFMTHLNKDSFSKNSYYEESSYSLANLYYKMSDWNRVVHILKDIKNNFDALYLLMQSYVKLGLYHEALYCLKNIKENFDQEEYEGFYFDLLNEEGSIHLGLANYDLAFKCFSKLEKSREKISTEKNIMLNFNIIHFFLEKGEYNKAEQCLLKTKDDLISFLPTEEHEYFSIIYNGLANVYINTNVHKYSEAITFQKKALNISKRIFGFSPLSLIYLNNIFSHYGKALSISQDIDHCLKLKEEMGLIKEEIENLIESKKWHELLEAGIYYNNIGHDFIRFQQYDNALVYLKKAENIFKRHKDEFNETFYINGCQEILDNLSIVYAALGEEEKNIELKKEKITDSILYGKKALKFRAAHFRPIHIQTATSLHNLAGAYCALSRTVQFPKNVKLLENAIVLNKLSYFIYLDSIDYKRKDVSLNLNNLMSIYGLLSVILEKNGIELEALYCFKNAILCYESITGETTSTEARNWLHQLLHEFFKIQFEKYKVPLKAIQAINQKLNVDQLFILNNDEKIVLNLTDETYAQLLKFAKSTKAEPVFLWDPYSKFIPNTKLSEQKMEISFYFIQENIIQNSFKKSGIDYATGNNARQISDQLELEFQPYVVKKDRKPLQHEKILNLFKDLGDLYLKEKKYLDAIAVYQLALAVSSNDQKNIEFYIDPKKYHSALNYRVELAEHYFLELIGSRNVEPNTADYKENLQKIRDEASTDLKQYQKDQSITIQEIYKNVSSNIKSFIKQMIADCEKILGEAPCPYTVLGLGSLARDEATPYSDFEWVILIENEEKIDYFRNLTQLVHMQILKLGETTSRMHHLTDLNWLNERYSETPIMNGFAFDGRMEGACKTPLGNMHLKLPTEKTFELIKTPKNMLKYIENYEKDASLADILLCCTYIYGSEELYNHYQIELEKLQFSVLTKERVLNQLLKDLIKHEPQLGRKTEEGNQYSAKYHFYRLPTLIIDALAKYKEIKFRNIWERIEALGKMSFFNQKALNNLKRSIDGILYKRLSLYLKNNSQKEDIVDDDDETTLEIFYTLIPLYDAAKHFYITKDEEKIFRENILFDDSGLAKANLYFKLYRFKTAFYYLCHGSDTMNDNEKPTLTQFLDNFDSYKTVNFFNSSSEEASDLFMKCAKKLDIENPLSQYIRFYKKNDFLDEFQQGICSFNASSFEKSKLILENTLKLFNAAQHFPIKLIEAYDYLLRTYIELGEFKNAEKLIIKGNLLMTQYGMERSIYHRNFLHNIAYFYDKQEMYDEAEKIYFRTIKIEEIEAGDYCLESVITLAQLGMVQIQQEDLNKQKDGEFNIEKSLKILKYWEDKSTDIRADLLHRRGEYYLARRISSDLTNAEKALKEAHNLFSSNSEKKLLNLSCLIRCLYFQHNVNNVNEMENYFKEFMKIKNNIKITNKIRQIEVEQEKFLCEAQLLKKKGSFEKINKDLLLESGKKYSEYLELVDDKKSRKAANAYYGLAECYHKMENLEEAEKYYEKSIGIYKELSKKNEALKIFIENISIRIFQINQELKLENENKFERKFKN